jgi:carbon monoxide dehydrogenase subunit G
MKLTAKEDIEAPIAFVSAMFTDFEMWEKSALRRGAEIERLDRLPTAGPGMEWKVGFDFREKKRRVEIKLTALTPEQQLRFDCMSGPAEADVSIDLAEMGAQRTRVVVTVDVKPRTLAARLFLQSLKLAKAKVTKRFALGLAQTGADIEDRYRARSKA